MLLTYISNASMFETDTLSGNELKVIGVTADWAARVINNTAELISFRTAGTHGMVNPVPHHLLWNHVLCLLVHQHTDIRYEDSDHMNGSDNTCICT